MLNFLISFGSQECCVWLNTNSQFWTRKVQVIYSLSNSSGRITHLSVSLSHRQRRIVVNLKCRLYKGLMHTGHKTAHFYKVTHFLEWCLKLTKHIFWNKRLFLNLLSLLCTSSTTPRSLLYSLWVNKVVKYTVTVTLSQIQTKDYRVSIPGTHIWQPLTIFLSFRDSSFLFNISLTIFF